MVEHRIAVISDDKEVEKPNEENGTKGGEANSLTMQLTVKLPQSTPRRHTSGLQVLLSSSITGGSLYPQVIRFKTYRGYVKPWIILNTIYNMICDFRVNIHKYGKV